MNDETLNRWKDFGAVGPPPGERDDPVHRTHIVGRLWLMDQENPPFGWIYSEYIMLYIIYNKKTKKKQDFWDLKKADAGISALHFQIQNGSEAAGSSAVVSSSASS